MASVEIRVDLVLQRLAVNEEKVKKDFLVSVHFRLVCSERTPLRSVDRLCSCCIVVCGVNVETFSKLN